MENKIFNKSFLPIICLFISAEIVSFFALQNQLLNTFLAIILGIAVLYLSLKNLTNGFYLLFAELLIGSKGYLFFFQENNIKISIRIIFFIALILAWLVLLAKKKVKWEADLQLTSIYAIFASVILLAAINGIINNSVVNFFYDFNNWLHFLLLPIFLTVFKNIELKSFWRLLFVGSIYLSLKTIFLLLIFSIYGRTELTALYDWIRNSGVGEITYITGNYYRIFIQSQIYILFSAIAAAIFLLTDKIHREQKWLLASLFIFSLAILASLSRSFWVGSIIGIICLILYLIKIKLGWQKISSYLALTIIVLISEMFFLCAITRTFNPGLFYSRLANSPIESAGSSRLNQIIPLLAEIKTNLLLGSGFGATATYISNDPRIRQEHSDGKYTTYAFELGWLDLWFKTGLLGIFAYLWLITHIILNSLKKGQEGLILALFCLSIATIHLFTPYLNHPLGIGLILIATAILNKLETTKNVIA